ncbi:MAG: glycoside hydrolase family 43 protein [Rikenellaceae bacterium]
MKRTLLTILSLLAVSTTTAQITSSPKEFTNPILSGFHPDPSICRVGEDYYLVNSSFEWYPGIPIYKSRDLVNWKLIGYGLHRVGQADQPAKLRDSHGVFATTIRYHDGLFYLITTNVGSGGNFYITATDPAGEWSDPVWLKSIGIDPSLFWDDDGKCYYTGAGRLNSEPEWEGQNGVWMQELDLEKGELIGERKQLTHGHATNARWTEGPHLYKIDGQYMLLVAEGGTAYEHAVTTFHSDNVWGPYTPDQSNPVLTHRHLGKQYPLQAIGHCDIVETQNGEWWGVALGKRMRDGYCYLARETFLAPLEFQDMDGVTVPVFCPGVGYIKDQQTRPDLEWSPYAQESGRDEFDSSELALKWNFLRTPLTQWHECTDGELIMNLRPEVAEEWVNPSLIAHRIEHYEFDVESEMTFRSRKPNEEAGIIIYRSSKSFAKCVRRGDRVLLIANRMGEITELESIECSKDDTITLMLSSDGRDITFAFSQSGKRYEFNKTVPLSVISFEEAKGYSGPYVGMYATSNGEESKSKAAYNYFDYKSKQ